MTDPLRPIETDEEPWTGQRLVYLPGPLEPDRSPVIIGYVLAAASGFIVGMVLMWAAR